MTLQELLNMALNRVGLTQTQDPFRSQARLYANIVAKDILGEARWFWAYKTGTLRTTRRLTVTGATGGDFTAGLEIRDAQSTYYSATIDSWDSTNGYLYVYSENAVTPTGTLTEYNSGSATGITATYSSREYTRTYKLSSDVDTLYYFVNETAGMKFEVVGPEEYVARDPERDDTRDTHQIIIEGLDSDTSTGQIQIAVNPRLSTTNETLRYGYYLLLPDWTEDDDATDLAKWIHPTVQPALVFGISELYKQEKGDDDGAEVDRNQFRRIIARAKIRNLNIQGNRRYRLRGNMGIGKTRRFDFSVAEGTLT